MKRIFSVLLVLVMLLSSVAFNTASAAKALRGDVNGDGTVSASDALCVLQHSIGAVDLDTSQKAIADLDGNGVVNSSDALFILKISVGIRSDGLRLDIDYKSYSSLDPKWMSAVADNYDEFISEVSGNSDRIPMIVSTDQHGTLTADCEVFKYVNDLVDWSKISKVINLGDTVELTFSKSELKAYSKAMQYVPVEKRLELFGNHDGHISAIRRDMSKYFVTSSAEFSKKNDAFVVVDEQFNVRYLSVDPMGYPWTYTSGRISTEQADFIVAQLEKTDSKNVVLLAHPYLFRDAIIKRDGTTFTGSDTFIAESRKGGDVKQSFLDMLLARKNKTAGVFVDSDGKKHNYDFTGCNGDFMMTLHGHHHTEGYETSNGITEFLFQSFRHDEPNCFYFAYIDTKTKKFKCWKNVEGYEAWEIDIA